MIREMNEDDFINIFLRHKPELFNYIYHECKLIYESETGIDIKDESYYKNPCLHFADAVVNDFGEKYANKIGKIIVDVTEI